MVERVLNIVGQYALNSVSSGNQGNSDALSTGVVNHLSLAMGDCCEAAVGGLEQILTSMVGFLDKFSASPFVTIVGGEAKWEDFYHQKEIKKYLQGTFIKNFNLKPAKTVDKLIKLFHDRISYKDLAVFFLKNMDYDSKLKKPESTIIKGMVGEFFGSRKETSQAIYVEFLNLLEPQMGGL